MAQASRRLPREIQVGCAIIEKKGRILIAQRRPQDSLGGFWEFPGGKRHDGETFEACIEREVREELGIEVRTRRFLRTVSHDYPEKRVHLFFYLCDFTSGEPVCHECQDFRWVKAAELLDFKFPPADRDILEDLIAKKEFYFSEELRGHNT